MPLAPPKAVVSKIGLMTPLPHSITLQDSQG